MDTTPEVDRIGQLLRRLGEQHIGNESGHGERA
jgi:hypothetical protein